jgi:F0F1-type ATP synthase assembly protein I
MEEDRDKKAEWRKIGIALSASWLLAASIAVCALAGLLLDRLFHARPTLLVTGFLVGVVAGMYNLIRELRRME